MLALIQYDLVTLLVALLIGIATGWWVFGRKSGASAAENQTEDSTRS